MERPDKHSNEDSQLKFEVIKQVFDLFEDVELFLLKHTVDSG